MHRDALVSDREVHLKIKSFFLRTNMVSTSERCRTTWESVRVPYINSDKYLDCFVFRRDFVDTIPSALPLVTFDCRRKQLRSAMKHRIECRICDGAVSNVGLCSHETTVHSLRESFTERNDSSSAHVLGIKSDREMGWVETSEIFEKEDNDCNRIEFVSKIIPNLFPCAAKDLIMQESIYKFCSFGQKSVFCVFRDLEIICNECHSAFCMQEGGNET